jgi:beta-mannosidase
MDLANTKSPVFLRLLIIFFIFLESCGPKDVSFSIQEIDEGWKFRRIDDETWQQANVPGSVHQDLLTLGQIPDPFIGTNEDKVQWIEHTDWEYQTTFSVDKECLKKNNIDLIFKGLDTYADIYLNNDLLLDADNMYRSWKIPVKDYVVSGNNTLQIKFHSPVRIGMEELLANGYAVPANGEQAPMDKRTSVFTRKAPYHYGWDWAPRLVTYGIWKPVLLHSWDLAHIEHFYVNQKEITLTYADYQLELNIQADSEKSLKAIVQINNEMTVSHIFKTKPGKNKVMVDLKIEDPNLWWTNGLGDPYLYDMKIQLMHGNTILDEKKHKLGVRTIEIVQEKDDVGESFYFKLNGVPVFMKGANYIPSDMMIPRVSEETYEHLLRTVAESNMNMLRICGCTIYEKDIFYDLCDQYGILIWQDFMFACNMVPAQAALIENIRKEAEENIIRLRNHPCIALWCGNNENLVGWYNWRWKERYGYSSEDSIELWQTYEKVFYEILPEAISTYDPERFYWASSPSSAFKELPNRYSGDQHDWSIWFDELPYESYKKSFGRFVSEYGLQAYPSLKTIKSFASSMDMDMNSTVMRHRQRCRDSWSTPGIDGNDMILDYIRKYYKEPKDFRSLVYLSQLIQAETYKYAISTHRRNMPQCMGSLYWQLNDCWPTISWSSLDYYQRWKASHYKARNTFAPIILSLVEGNDHQTQLFIVSDKLKKTQGVVEIQLIDFDGKEIWNMEQKIDIKPNTSEMIYEDILHEKFDFDPSRTCLTARLYIENQLAAEDFFYFRLSKDLNLSKPEFQKEIKKIEKDYEITLSCDKLAKNVYLELPEKNGHFSDNFFDLPVGGNKQIVLSTNETGIKPEDINIFSLVDTY